MKVGGGREYQMDNHERDCRNQPEGIRLGRGLPRLLSIPLRWFKLSSVLTVENKCLCALPRT